jgi:hypothetical protein
MKLILAGWLTVGLALLWDRFLNLTGIKETTRVGILVPIGEELLKYSISYLSQLFPPFLYVIFGLGEGVFESIQYKKRFDVALIIAGILPHAFFSIFFLFKLPFRLSLILAIVCHCVWNLIVLNLKNECNKSAN